MGSRGTYWRTAGFASYTESDLLWKMVGEVDGMKIIRRPDRSNGSLPEFAKTSEAYIEQSKEGKLVSLRVYDKTGFPIYEFNLGHSHHHGMKEGEVHVHEFVKLPDGNPWRNPHGDKPSAEQMDKWGGIIREMKRRNAQ